jgi:hypothetical protein
VITEILKAQKGEFLGKRMGRDLRFENSEDKGQRMATRSILFLKKQSGSILILARGGSAG